MSPPNLPLTRVLPARGLKIPRQAYMMSHEERAILVALLRELQTRTVIETGVHEGTGAEILLLNVPTITRYIGVDVEPGYRTSKASQQTEIPTEPGKLVRHDPRFELITRPRGSLDLRPADLPTCDAFIIDGDHGREAVAWDTYLAGKRTRPGGLIIWHDYYTGEDGTLDVKDFLNERATNGKATYHIENTWLAIERKGEPP